jgi:radical SAM protein with 4Fe4S-binding SPASM domain
MIEVHINIVGGCQLRCIGCPNSTMQRKITPMSLETFNSCLKNIDVSHIKLLRLFNFGEPLLHPNLPDIIAQIPKQSWTTDMVEISTNAQYFDEKQLTAIFKTGVLKRLAVSCDGDGTAEEYERIRTPAKWEKLLHFLSNAKALRDKYASDLILMTRTCCEDDEGRERWTKLLSPLGWEPEFRNYQIFPQSIQNIPGRKLIVRDGACRWLEMGRLYVDYDGIVIPCCVHPRVFELGDLKKEKYSKIFYGKKRKLFLRKLKNKKNMPICMGCEW